MTSSCPRRFKIKALCLVLAASANAYAQDKEGSTPVLEEIVIIGEKIERSYLQTFSSVGLVSAEDLNIYDIYDTQEAYRRLANVRAFSDPTGGNSISIRGLNADGVTQPSNSAALISVVIDGVTQSVEGLKRGSRGLWDVEQVEVHRGPQSTIQGRNALAGTVVIKTRKPTFEPEVRLRGLFGDLDRREAAFAVSGPVIEDQLALRLSGSYAEKSNDIEVTDTANKPFIKDEHYNIRARALYKPANISGLEVDLIFNHVFDSPTSAPVSGPDFFERKFAANSAFAEFRELDANNYSVNIAYELSERMTLRSVSAYYDSSLDIFSSPTSTSYEREDERADSDFTQEFRLEITESDARLSGVAGLFYGDFEKDTVSFVSYPAFNLVAQDGTFNNSTETIAVYADFRYRIIDDASIIVGGRYQHDKVNNSIDLKSDFGDVNTQLPSDYNVFLPKAGIAFDLSDNQTIALTAAKGYRQGFGQTAIVNNTRIVDEVDPEYSWTYDIAYRLTSDDNRFTLGANIFFNDYTDQQIAVTDPNNPTNTITANAGDSESMGLELETRFRFDNGLTVYAALGLLETELGNFESKNCPDNSCDGNTYTQAPKVTAALGGNYQHNTGFFGSLAANYTDKFNQSISNNEALRVDSAVLVNGKLGYNIEKVTVSLYANNLLDEEYLTGIISANQATIGNGRHIGIEIQADF